LSRAPIHPVALHAISLIGAALWLSLFPALSRLCVLADALVARIVP